MNSLCYVHVVAKIKGARIKRERPDRPLNLHPAGCRCPDVFWTKKLLPQRPMTKDQFKRKQAKQKMNNLEAAQSLGLTYHIIENYRSGKTPIPAPVAQLIELKWRKK